MTTPPPDRYLHELPPSTRTPRSSLNSSVPSSQEKDLYYCIHLLILIVIVGFLYYISFYFLSLWQRTDPSSTSSSSPLSSPSASSSSDSTTLELLLEMNETIHTLQAELADLRTRFVAQSDVIHSILSEPVCVLFFPFSFSYSFVWFIY